MTIVGNFRRFAITVAVAIIAAVAMQPPTSA
jgi:hypothetical protein